MKFNCWRNVNIKSPAADKDASKERMKTVKKSSSLYKLDPFLDKEGVLRVGGRLRQSSIPYAVKQPVILPKKGHVMDLCRCQEFVTDNLSGLFGNPQIANDYNLTNDSQNKERTDSNHAASHSYSSGASTAACTDVVSILKTSLNWTRKCYYYQLSLPHCVTVEHSFAF